MGGATQSLLSLVKYCIFQGYNCKVLFLKEEGNALVRYREEGIDVITDSQIQTYAHAYGAYNKFLSKRPWRVFTRMLQTFNSIKKAEYILNRESPKLVYLNTSVLIPFAIASKRINIPVIWHLREQIHNGIFGFRKKIIKYLFKKYSDTIISISEINAKVIGIENIKVVYNSVDFGQFNFRIDKESAKNRFSLINPFVISFVGGKVLSKGADLLIESLLEVHKVRNDFDVIISGTFERSDTSKMNKIEKNVLKLLNQNTYLKKKIQFTGSLPNVAEVLAASDLLIWPATSPHFARPIMEAMVMGKAVIASDFESSMEILEHKREGLLVKPEPKSIANAILFLMANPKVLKQMGDLAHQKAKYLFNANENNRLIVNYINPFLK